MRVYVGAIDLMGATGDWKKFLDRAKKAGASGIRIFICYSWNGEQPSPGSPYKKVGTWTHPTTGDKFPKYRLREWNQAFWTKLWSVLVEMKKIGLTAWLVCEDYCSLKGNKTEKYFNPFYSSEEALSPSTPGGVWGNAMKTYHAALYYRTIFWANASKCPYLIEAMNEIGIVDGTDEEIIAWSKWANDTISITGATAEVDITTGGTGMRAKTVSSPSLSTAVEISKQVGIYSPHRIGTAEKVKPTPGILQEKTLYSSDGYWGGTGPADAKGRRGVGIDQAKPIARKVTAVHGVGFELFDRGIWRQNNDRGNLDLFNPVVLKLMTE